MKVRNLEGQSLAQIIIEWNSLDRKRLKIAELLSKDPRIDWNIKDKGGSDFLIMSALKKEKMDLVKILINAPGVDLNVTDSNGQTLHQIARYVKKYVDRSQAN